MFRYAQLNEEDTVVGISDLSGEVPADNMILINDLDVMMGSTYDRNSGVFTPPVVVNDPTPVEPQPTLEEMQAQTLLNTEMLLIQKELETEASV